MNEEPWHRAWLHALEDEPTAPGTVMQLARILADYASRYETYCSVPWMTLIRQTHRTRTAISDATGWLVEHGWLAPRPHKNGQRLVYDLTLGHPGEKIRARSGPLGGPVRQADRSAGQTGTSPLGGPVRQADRSAGQTGTSPLGGPRTSTSFQSLSPLSPRGLHAALAEQVQDVTERESDQVRAMIGRRPGVRSAAAVMRTEIEAGNGPALVAEVRGVRPAATPRETHPFRRHPETGWCSICRQPETAATHDSRRPPGTTAERSTS